MNEEPSDPVERADQRRQSPGSHDVTVESDGSVKQKPHGNMDATMVAPKKEHPEQGPYVPEHDHVDPDVEPDSESCSHSGAGTDKR
jgi:hypothetical protein